MIEIRIASAVNGFAEDKDIARQLRQERILPAIKNQEEVIVDFKGVEGATQSFVHALISDLIRKEGAAVLDRIYFKNCNETIKKIISIVVDYMQESE